jgi:hypothetical protein
MLGPTEAQQEIRQIVRQLSETEGLCDSPPDPSIVDRVMQLQQSHPPILVGAGDLIPAAGPHRLTVCKSDWQISGKWQLSALEP